MTGRIGVAAVFLDRDGVLTIPQFRDGRSYAPTTLETFEVYSQAEPALKALKDSGFTLIVVTNQPDVGKGIIALEAAEAMHEKLMRVLPLDAIEACYHTGEAGCGCRKPAPGMILAALKSFPADRRACFLIGDQVSDVEAAANAGIQGFRYPGDGLPLDRFVRHVLVGMSEEQGGGDGDTPPPG